MTQEDPLRYNIRSPEGGYLCPACGFLGYFDGTSYDADGPLIATGICPCCTWEPGFDDEPLASGAPDSILESLRLFRRGWTSLGPAWMGDPKKIPPGWDGKAQFERLLNIAPWVK